MLRRTLLGLLVAGVLAFGSEQSPIDITSANTWYNTGLAPLQFSYSASANLTLKNINSPDEEGTIRAIVPGGSTVTLSGVTYDLLQFHFHIPSEHEVNGAGFSAEVHFVNRSQIDNTLLVVGRFITIGPSSNAGLATLFGSMTSIPNPDDQTAINNYNIAALLPSTQTTFRYNGSLTTSPYSEGVLWNVFTDDTLQISQADFDIMAGLFPDGNSREVQNLDGRIIQTDMAGFADNTVPEPGTFLLLGASFAGLAWRRYRTAA